MGKFIRKLLVGFWDLVESVTFALALFVVSYLFFFQPGIVHGVSSYPTWKEDERFITGKVTYLFGSPQRGDFVVMISPQNSNIDFIKRVVGLPGETIKINNCNVYINDQLLNETAYLQPGICTGPESYLQNNQQLRVPDGYYFLMGDNREHSSDSRDFGPISKSSIVGKVIFRYWPLDRVGPIH